MSLAQQGGSLARRVLLPAWATGTLVLSALGLAPHLLSLPTPPADDPTLAVAVAELPSAEGAWTMLHALSSECRCSQRVLEHLLAGRRPPGVSETIALVGPDAGIGARATAAGFRFIRLTSEELAQRFAVRAVPVLVIADPGGAVRYSGGYTDRKQGADIRDITLLDAARLGAPKAALPLFGCAVSADLQANLQPLGSIP